MKTIVASLGLMMAMAGSLAAQAPQSAPKDSVTNVQLSAPAPAATETPAPAQAKTSSCKFQFSRMYFGGALGMNFSNENTNVIIQPLVGYRFTEILSAGVLFDYEYSKNGDFSSNTIGGGVFGQVDMPIIPNKIGLSVHMEYDYLHRMYDTNGIKSSDNDSYLPSGVGIFTYAGRSRISVLALWDLLHLGNDNSGTPTIRISASF